jgi:hypothetical protein
MLTHIMQYGKMGCTSTETGKASPYNSGIEITTNRKKELGETKRPVEY